MKKRIGYFVAILLAILPLLVLIRNWRDDLVKSARRITLRNQLDKDCRFSNLEVAFKGGNISGKLANTNLINELVDLIREMHLACYVQVGVLLDDVDNSAKPEVIPIYPYHLNIGYSKSYAEAGRMMREIKQDPCNHIHVTVLSENAVLLCGAVKLQKDIEFVRLFVMGLKPKVFVVAKLHASEVNAEPADLNAVTSWIVEPQLGFLEKLIYIMISQDAILGL
jgi:hypothetical protein